MNFSFAYYVHMYYLTSLIVFLIKHNICSIVQFFFIFLHDGKRGSRIVMGR